MLKWTKERFVEAPNCTANFSHFPSGGNCVPASRRIEKSFRGGIDKSVKHANRSARQFRGLINGAMISGFPTKFPPGKFIKTETSRTAGARRCPCAIDRSRCTVSGGHGAGCMRPGGEKRGFEAEAAGWLIINAKECFLYAANLQRQPGEDEL